jgi:hypothetical protein
MFEGCPGTFRLYTAVAGCRSRTCLVLIEDAHVPYDAEMQTQMYCTCRCGAPPELGVPEASLCTCPDGQACVTVAGSEYHPGIQGSYCVPVHR